MTKCSAEDSRQLLFYVKTVIVKDRIKFIPTNWQQHKRENELLLKTEKPQKVFFFFNLSNCFLSYSKNKAFAH